MPPSGKRKRNGVEEITFNPEDRREYLTGFHKRFSPSYLAVLFLQSADGGVNRQGSAGEKGKGGGREDGESGAVGGAAESAFRSGLKITREVLI
jgi:Nucleolar protein 12 (25kDa)